nr:MAG TPA: RNA binding domain protein [Caudoviricetes sp.]
MNCVERVKQICKERKVPISRLEKDLGFSNMEVLYELCGKS